MESIFRKGTSADGRNRSGRLFPDDQKMFGQSVLTGRAIKPGNEGGVYNSGRQGRIL